MTNSFVIYFICLREELNIMDVVKPASFLFFSTYNQAKYLLWNLIVSALTCYAICQYCLQ